MAEFNPLFLSTGSIRQMTSSLNTVIDYIHFPVTQSGTSSVFTTTLPDPYLVASQSRAVSNAVNTTSSSLYEYNIPNRVEDYFYSTNAIIGVSSSVTTTGVRIGLQRSQNANTAFNIKSPSTLTAFTFACAGTEDNTIFVLPAGHAAINTIYPTHVRGLTSNILTSPTSSISNVFLVQPETNNIVTATTGSVFYNQFAGFDVPNLGVDTTFNVGTGVSSSNFPVVYQVIEDSNSKIIAVGNIERYSGSIKDIVVRINSDGTIDNSFNITSGSQLTVWISGYTVAQQQDGKILLGGRDTSGINLVRLNSDGTTDFSLNIGTGFTNSPFPEIKSVKLQSDNKILVGGSFTSYSGSSISHFMRLNESGSIDTSFNQGTGLTGGSNFSVEAVEIQPDGKILVGGEFITYSGSTQNRITRINPDGSRDTSFNIGTGFNAQPRAIKVQPDNKILVGGIFSSYSGSTRNRIVRLNSDGTIDTSFNIGSGFPAGSGVYSLDIQSDNKILVGGVFTSYSGSSVYNIARINPDGTIDPSFTPITEIKSAIVSIIQKSDGNIIVGGQSPPFNSSTYNAIVGLLENYQNYNTYNAPLYLLSGSLKAISGSDTVTSRFLPPTSSLWISQSLTANVSNSSNTVYATVFDTAGLVTGQRYLVNLYIAASTAATTTGFRMRVQNGTEYNGSLVIPTSTTAVAIQNSANGTGITNTVPTAAPAGNFLAYGEYTFVKGATNPQVQIISEINTSFVTAATGSVVFYRPIS